MAQENAPTKTKVSPDVCSYVDEEHTTITLEIMLPGIKKETIKLKMHEDSFNLFAPGQNFDYVTSMAFCCPVKANEATAEYENGLLKVEAPFKDPMEDAVEVSIT